MQAHNVRLYELLRHVYTGSVEHQDPKSLSKEGGHIVTFSWDRGSQGEDEWWMMGADENAFDAERESEPQECQPSAVLGHPSNIVF